LPLPSSPHWRPTTIEAGIRRSRQRSHESKDPGPMASGSGCKSPAGRRRGSGDWSAGRSAASRDGRRALIARSQDLPCPGRLDATREQTGVYGPGSRPIHPTDPPWASDAADSLLPRHPARSHTSHGSVPREDIDRVAGPRSGNGGGRPPFSAIPAPNSVPHACSERPRNARAAALKRAIALRLRRRATDGIRCASDESRLDAFRLEADKSWLLGS